MAGDINSLNLLVLDMHALANMSLCIYYMHVLVGVPLCIYIHYIRFVLFSSFRFYIQVFVAVVSFLIQTS